MNKGPAARMCIACAVVLSLLGAQSFAAQSVEWFFTNDQQQWANKGLVQTGSTVPVGTTTITINPDSLRQEMLGFGGCFNEKGWDALSVLDATRRDGVLRALFDTAGCAFNYCRTPMGASDYAMNYYSLDDSSGDYALDHFSIDRDRGRLIPYIKAAQTFCPGLQVWGVPWTVPRWMMGSGVFGTPAMFTSLALYFEKYVQAYRGEGINVAAVHVMNEPCGGGGGVNTVYTAQQMHDFIRYYLGPRFVQDGVNGEIWLGDLNCSYDPYVSTVFNDPEAAKYVSGVGLQYGGRPDIAKVASFSPAKKVMQTETMCYNGANSWSDGFGTVRDMFDDINKGANAYMQWNMVLDETGANFTTGWVQNSMITVNKSSKTVTLNPQYHCVKHFSHFVKRGARVCKVSGAPWSNAVLAFVNPTGEVVVVDNAQSAGVVALKVGSETAVVNVTSGLHTFVFKGGSTAVRTAPVTMLSLERATTGNRTTRLVSERLILSQNRGATGVVDLYCITGEKIGRTSINQDGRVMLDKRSLGRQIIMARAK